MADSRGYYATLGVEVSSSTAQIKTAFRKMALVRTAVV